ncbi:MAG: hypothetical protein KJ065_04410 [Anaerolineae bacterium]|nr:hypothetical protein [Anaerolineae bacterium]
MAIQQVKEFFAAVGHNVPILKPGQFGVQVAPTSLGLLDTFEAWEKRVTRQIVFESVAPYPTIIVHVTYETEMPDRQAAVKKAIKGLLTSMLKDEALSSSGLPLEFGEPATA